MALMTFDKAIAMYEQQTTEALILLEELKAADCPVPGDIERQHEIAARAAAMRDRVRLIHNDRMAKTTNY
jgi:hypothetical protein